LDFRGDCQYGAILLALVNVAENKVGRGEKAENRAQPFDERMVAIIGDDLLDEEVIDHGLNLGLASAGRGRQRQDPERSATDLPPGYNPSHGRIPFRMMRLNPNQLTIFPRKSGEDLIEDKTDDFVKGAAIVAKVVIDDLWSAEEETVAGPDCRALTGGD